MDRIIIIDGNSLLYRAYYATAAMGNLMMNKDGVPTNAVYGFSNMMENLLKQEPKYVLVAFDYGKKTFRNELFDVYKQTRSSAPDELSAQFSMVREYLDAHGIVYQEVEGYEGDDVIGTVATQLANEGIQVDIITSDKDMLQLIKPNVHVLITRKGVNDIQVMDEAAFFEQYKLVPDRMRDIKGLMGDKADNIPGIPGIGEKTALKLLHEYDTIENLAENVDQLKGKLKEKIATFIDQGLLSKKIATIITDVEIDIDLANYEYKGYDYQALADFYKRYDMNSLLKKMGSRDDLKPSQFEYAIVSTCPDNLKDIALSVAVYDANYHKSPVLGFGIAAKEKAYFISFQDALSDAKFKSMLEDEDVKKTVYDQKKVKLALRWNSLEIRGIDFDVQLAAYILNPATKDEIKYVVDNYIPTAIDYDENVYGKGAKKHVPDNAVLARHLCLQADGIMKIKDRLVEELNHSGQYDLYADIEMPVSDILADMEFFGAKVDIAVLKDLEKTFNERIDELTSEIFKYAGHEFTISSPKQLGVVLFEELGLKSFKKTKTGYSTNVDVLEKLSNDHAIIDAILEYRRLTKLVSTYVTGLQEQVFGDGKIHTMYNQALTQTGRLSSTDPNLQNIPVRTPEGKLIRKAFIPANDYLVSYDYSQIELRVLAHLANVEPLIKAFNDDQDIHRYTASEVFNVPYEEVTSQMRHNAKAVNFGIIYGISDFGLASQINVSRHEAKEYIESYFQKYPQIKTYMDKNIEKCKKEGYVTTICNRKRFIPEINEKNRIRQQLGERLAMNSPIQGSAADILKLAMIKVSESFKKHKLKSKLILQVHDELIFDVCASELELVEALAIKGMKEAYDLKVELKVEGNHAKNWYDLK